MNLNYISQEMARIAKEAGQFLRKQQQGFSSDRVQTKSLNSLVSDVDKNTEKMLVDALGRLLPEAGFLAEEGTASNREDQDWIWIIDPLDGTTNFIHGLPIFSVSLALSRKGTPVIGVVYEVGLDECFVAYEGGGAFLNGNPIHVSPTGDLKNSLLATGFPYYNFDQIDGFQNTLKHFYQHTRGLRRIGTAAVDLAYVAAGRFDGYFEHSLQPWDVAAGVVLVREAGGTVTDFQNTPNPLPYKSIIATNKALFQSVFYVVNNNMGNA